MRMPKGGRASFLRGQAVLAAAFTALTIGLGVVLSEVQSKVGWPALLVALGAVLVAYTASSWIALMQVSEPIGDLGDWVSELCSTYSELGGIGWLTTSARLARAEAQTPAREIWVVTSDLLQDVPGGRYAESVSAKLRDHTVYRFFVPNREELLPRIHELRQLHGDPPNLHVVPVPYDRFLLAPKWDFLIYNPLGGGPEPKEGYMELPVEPGETRYLVKLRPDVVDLLVGRLLSVIPGQDAA